MSRRTIPPIAPADLRDHADEARIGRIWDRLEHDLTGVEPAPRAGGATFALIAAAIGAFAGGVFVGKSVWEGDAPAAIPAVVSSDRPKMDVFAAGSTEETFSLPGGGQLTLQPGATMEIVSSEGAALTLRLVQGDAVVDTRSVPEAAGVAIEAGEARLAAAAGSIVRLDRDRAGVDVGVNVTDGSVTVTSPRGREEVKPGQEGVRVPIRADRTSRAPSAERPTRTFVPAPRNTAEPVAEAAPLTVAQPAGWYALHREGQWNEAAKALKVQGFDHAINQATSAAELIAIADLAGGGPLASKAYERVLAMPGVDATYAGIAARYLGKIYEKSDPELAKKYFERAGASLGVIGDDALCHQIRTAKNNDEAAAKAKEYVTQYPNGSCKDEAERILQGDEESDEDTAPAPSSPDKSEPPSKP